MLARAKGGKLGDVNTKEKHLIIVGGPNGSGKTSVTEFLLEQGIFPIYFNADTIAKGYQHGPSGVGDLKAGRIMIDGIQQSLKSGRSFGFETTLSGKMWERTINHAKTLGYEVTLCFVAVRTVEDSIKRVQFRSEEGGHHIPEEDLRRRFPRSIEHFFNRYSKLADNWYFFDNTGNTAILVAYQETEQLKILDDEIFRYYQQIRNTTD